MRLALLATLAVLLLAGCTSGADEGDTDNASTTATPSVVADPEMPEPGETYELSFFEGPGVGIPPRTMGITPATLEVAAGKQHTLVLTNDGQAPHDLVIEGLVDTDTFAPGGSIEVPLLAPSPGEYAYYCSVGGDGPAGHRAQGMQGTLTVV